MKKSGSCTILLHELMTILLVRDVVSINHLERGPEVSKRVCLKFTKRAPSARRNYHGLQCLESNALFQEFKGNGGDIGTPVMAEAHHGCSSIRDHEFPGDETL
jgi:hypothetical protein